MLPILLSVIVISFSGVMMPGPMFAVTLAKSYKSPLAGLQISAGHAVVEVPLILLIYLGFARFFQQGTVQLVLSIVGGSMIIWMGTSLFRARKTVVEKGHNLPYNSFVAGIITSGLNPFFLLWWATIGGMLIMRFTDFGAPGIALLTTVHWLCDLAWLSLVSIVIYRTRALWSRKAQEAVFVVCSLLLVGFGVWYLYSGLSKFV